MCLLSTTGQGGDRHSAPECEFHRTASRTRLCLTSLSESLPLRELESSQRGSSHSLEQQRCPVSPVSTVPETLWALANPGESPHCRMYWLRATHWNKAFCCSARWHTTQNMTNAFTHWPHHHTECIFTSRPAHSCDVVILSHFLSHSG